MRVMRLALGVLLAAAFGIGFASLASAKGPVMRIADLKCNGDPEVVTIENRGDAAQPLAGWKLQSDPASEVFDLSVLGSMQPGASVFIQAGPSATGVFKWGTAFVFRDNDPSDYVRIVDNTGATVHQVTCGSAPSQPSPTPSPANGVPNGGGAPPLTGGPLTSEALVAAGIALAAAGAAAIVFLVLRAGPVAAAAAAVPSPVQAAAPSPVQAAPAVANDRRVAPHRRPSAANGPAMTAVVALAALGLLVALAFLLFRGRD